ncbi:MAG: hypothetical protein LBG19_06695 [Prevotellaceae bacterium]|jgi:hypothetical protein|nr:hypothetical protein [Prevotellaceae bacterium]
MFDFIAVIAVIGIITLGIYRLVELFARRKERMMIIEKMQENINSSVFTDQLNLPFIGKSKRSNWALRASLLMIGLGVGFIAGLIILIVFSHYLYANEMDHSMYEMDYNMASNLKRVIYLSSELLFGGIGLLAAYLIERKQEKNQA